MGGSVKVESEGRGFGTSFIIQMIANSKISRSFIQKLSSDNPESV